MKLYLIAALAFLQTVAFAQHDVVLAKNETKEEVRTGQKIVIVTGARFSYKLVQKWIDEYYKIDAETQIIIESRGSQDPAKYDVLAEVYPLDTQPAADRNYVNVGRYAVLPVANAKSEFGNVFAKKGVTADIVKQVYFHNLFADKDEQREIKAPYTVYTRLQKAGVPIVFSKHYGFEQKDINGKSIAGSDEHLLKALLRDSTGISYLPSPLAYNMATGKPIDGLTILPVDLDGNGKVSDEEKIFDDLNVLINKLETSSTKDIKGLPVAFLHLSIASKNSSPEAQAFVQWVKDNGHFYLHEFGYLSADGSKQSLGKADNVSSSKGN